MPSAHSILGASSSHRWLNCPGSIRLSAGMPKTSSKYADEGTAAHELAEMCLENRTVARKYIGSFITVGETAYEVTEEMVEAVQLYLDVVRSDLQDAGKGAELEVEKRFHLDWLYDGMFGTNDALVGQPFGLLRVYDFKYGAGVAVDVTDNTQLMYYALGAAHGETYDEVELIIVQPRAQHPDGPVRRQRMSVAELDRWADQVLLPGAEETEKADAPTNAGEWCRFCPAMAICPAQKEVAIRSAQFAFQDKPQAPPMAASLAPSELRQILDKASMIEAWLESCREHARLLLEQGADPNELGYKLVAGRASRKWIDEADAEQFLTTLDIDPFEHKLKSPAQAEKALRGPAKKALEDMVQTVRGVQLAPLSDKREAVGGAAALAFKEVEL